MVVFLLCVQSVCVRVCVCVCLRMYVCVCVFIYIYICIHMGMCGCACASMCKRVYVHVCICICTYISIHMYTYHTALVLCYAFVRLCGGCMSVLRAVRTSALRCRLENPFPRRACMQFVGCKVRYLNSIISLTLNWP